jgi:hypothetical protein
MHHDREATSRSFQHFLDSGGGPSRSSLSDRRQIASVLPVIRYFPQRSKWVAIDWRWSSLCCLFPSSPPSSLLIVLEGPDVAHDCMDIVRAYFVVISWHFSLTLADELGKFGV